ncbi:MAG TPA: 4Fe-4S dicluster domain-containing protein [Planctomycetota bacterium]|nr:4Fe-4S dicluster domain-containing protein [Planctomycetota bacterium]
MRRVCQAASFALFLLLLLYVAWPYAERFSTRVLTDKEWVPAELFLWLDPLASVAAAVAGRCVGPFLLGTAAILAASLLVPRVFCSHVCPLGATIDVLDWVAGRRLKRLHVRRRGAWIHAKYYVLAAVMVAAALGVMLAGHVAAIPVATRGFVFLLAPAQLAAMKHASMVRPVGWDYWLAIALFLCIPALGVLGRRFWCRALCPSGALFSLASPLRLRERRVTEACVRCGKCVEACTFDAIRPDFTTRPAECAFCPDCAHACPVDAIEFGWRRSGQREVPEGPCLSRRALLGASAAGALAAAGVLAAPRPRLLRPPGSVREDRFLELCVRCGLCLKVCPGPVLHPAGIEAGLDALWTPVAVPSWAGCHQDCNFCGQVCPTGAVRALPIEAKRRVHMGLAVVNTRTCLPHAGKRDCQLCYDECRAAGYDAIEMRAIRLDTGDVPEGVLSAAELEEASRILAPFVKPDACVGCGLCEYRCGTAWAKQQRLLHKSAIAVVPENEDRPA